LGKIGEGWCLSFETYALDIIGAEFQRELEPGEMVAITAENGVESHFPFRPQPSKFCIFEHVYFSRPNSILGGRCISMKRPKPSGGNWPKKARLKRILSARAR